MVKIYWIISIVLFCFGVAQGQGTDSTYSFFVAGHTYGAPGVNNEGLHPPFTDKFSYIQSRPEIDFGVLLGDIVSPDPVEQDWIEVDADIDTLGLPVYFAVGNHDMENRPVFEERYGDTYYKFIYSNDLFIVLDPNIDGWNISGDQKNFLINAIDNNANDVEKIFVFFHQLLWWESDNKYSVVYPNSLAGRADTINFWSEIEPLFKELDNEVVMFAGDIGVGSKSVMYDKYDNITFIATGMGNGEKDNFIVINEQDGPDISYDLICLTGELNCLSTLESNDVDNMSNQQESKLQVSVYPNPLSGYDDLRLDYDSFYPSVCQLFNEYGSLVFEKEIEQEQTTLDFSDIPSGVYILKLRTSNDVIFKKIVKI
ncbi:MAG: T9SS type A sorting domain-containing protein [Bacteroidales bacterium]